MINLENQRIPVAGASERDLIAPPDSASGADFGSELTKAIGAVDELQVDADKQATLLANGGGNLHETALALEKADVAMHVATKARNKVVDAYQEIMRMSV